jgi:methionyl-tRNA synthetase
MKAFYLTTAIDYANGSPHLGHAYEKVLTDVIARFRRQMGDRVHFLTGTDEHGQKVQASARKRGVPPQQFVDEVSQEFRALLPKLAITNDDFIRTTEERHKRVVRDLLQKLYDQGDIYRAEYRGFYSTRQEQFLQEKDRLPDGTWPEIFGEVTEITEANYFFRLQKYQGWLIDFLTRNENFVFPKYRQAQVLEFLKEPLNDLCISRPKERLEWGIPLPFDENYVTYVWFDALTNYYSAVIDLPDVWPANYHVIGKDILVPPHAVYWMIMLHAAGVPLPLGIIAHGWWLQRGAKMSKSTGNALNPLDLVDQFGTDAFRYFLMREMNVGQDSDFTPEQFLVRYNSELANNLGNLVNRTLEHDDAVRRRRGADRGRIAGTRGGVARTLGTDRTGVRRPVRGFPVSHGAGAHDGVCHRDQRLHREAGPVETRQVGRPRGPGAAAHRAGHDGGVAAPGGGVAAARHAGDQRPGECSARIHAGTGLAR